MNSHFWAVKINTSLEYKKFHNFFYRLQKIMLSIKLYRVRYKYEYIIS